MHPYTLDVSMQNRNCIPFRETLCDFVAYRTGNHHSMLCLNYCMLKSSVAMPQYKGTLVHSGHKDFAERWPSHWQVTRVESFELSKSSEFPRMLMFWGDVLRVHGKNGKMFPPPLWVYRSQECLSLMVDVLKVLCTSISLMSWLRYTAHGAAACRSDCHSLSKWSSLLTRHDLPPETKLKRHQKRPSTQRASSKSTSRPLSQKFLLEPSKSVIGW